MAKQHWVDINAEYNPGKRYPVEGLITGEVLTHYDEKLIREFLRGEKSRFGEFRVVEWLGRVSRSGARYRQTQGNWRIQCSCGWEREITHDNLNMMRNRLTNIDEARPDCGNPIHKDEWKIGVTYDRLTITGHSQQRFGSKGSNTWMLETSCSCGKHTALNPYCIPPSYIRDPLAKGQTEFGCGCRNASQDGRSNSPEHQRWSNARRRAKKFGLAFDIDINDCVAPKLCPVLGIPLSAKATGGPTDNSPTLDRIDPAKGYVKGNVAVISNRANRIKNDGTVDEIRKIADWLEQKLST